MKQDAFLFQNINPNQPLHKAQYHKEIVKMQEQANILAHYAHKKKRAIILVFEGWDAGGKGGAIRRLTSKMDPRLFSVRSVSAPNEVEKQHHYLWRFWGRLPAAGYIGIFDRSWYGRLLVERVEGFAKEEEWQRSFEEIRNFERDLTDWGAIICKFWLQISPEEQLKRFELRKIDPMRRYKLTEEDWRNREKWGLYETAAEEMFLKTHSESAPWFIMPANNKYFARLKLVEIFCNELQRNLGL